MVRSVKAFIHRALLPGASGEVNEPISTAGLYRPLDIDRQEIRLLILEPGSEEDTVKCSIRHVFLEESIKPKYETISYVWGDPTVKATIQLDGRKKEIPASSERVLRRFRFLERKRTLWIDAICINQDDLEERASQVSLMYEIFSNTERNLIWLGEEDETTGDALATIHGVVDDMRDTSNNFKDAHNMMFDKVGNMNISPVGFSVPISGNAIVSFFMSPWFSRLWVVQEASLAPSSICYRGSYQIDFDDVLRAGAWLYYKRTHLDPPLHESLLNVLRMHDLCDLKSGKYLAAPHRGDFQNLLIDMNLFNASEPRDYVFGILGLSQKTGMLENIPKALEPNYLRPIADVYMNATKYCIEDRANLDILPHVLPHIEQGYHPGLPSWAVNLAHKNSYRTDGVFTPYSSFRADGGVAPDVPDHFRYGPPEHLVLRGVVVDEIQATTDSTSQPWSKTIENGQMLSNLKLSLLAPTGDSLQDMETGLALAMSLTFGVDQMVQRWNTHDCYTSWCSYLTALETPDYRIPENPFHLDEHATHLDKVTSAFAQAIYEGFNKKKLFCTASGYFGNGPRTLESQDVVVVAYGSRFPVILRQSRMDDSLYEFVGVCYVYGIMDGEAVERHRAAGTEDVLFTLI